jgi:hypothetical protein
MMTIGTICTFAEAVAEFAQKFGGSCTSWGRTAVHNTSVGGVHGSPHVSWLGADLVYDTPAPLADREAAAHALGLQLIAEATHDHLQPIGWVNTV